MDNLALATFRKDLAVWVGDEDAISTAQLTDLIWVLAQDEGLRRQLDAAVLAERVENVRNRTR